MYTLSMINRDGIQFDSVEMDNVFNTDGSFTLEAKQEIQGRGSYSLKIISYDVKTEMQVNLHYKVRGDKIFGMTRTADYLPKEFAL